jgi:hypothetical protein
MKHYSQLKSEFFRDLLVEKPMPNLPAGGMLIFVSYFLVTVYEEKQGSVDSDGHI